MSRSGRLTAVGLLAICAPLISTVAARPSPELELEVPRELEHLTEKLESIARDDFSGALGVTGLMGFTASIRVIVAPEKSDVARRTPRWVSGFADGPARVIVVFPSRVSGYPDNNLRTLIHHEVAHVLVAEAARNRAVPRWFNEGVATVAAREWGLEDRARYAAAVVGRGPRTTAELDQGFAAGGRRAIRSYALSAALVRWLRSEFGDFVTVHILDDLGRGLGFDEAFVRATGVPLDRAEHRFFVREALWHTWVPFLTSSGALWAAITALALIAIRRRRQRSAVMRDRWEVEEELQMETAPEGRSPRVDSTTSHNLDASDDEVVN
jgi:hypothetical protein